MRMNLKNILVLSFFMLFLYSCLKYDNTTSSGKSKTASCEDFAKLRFRPIDTFQCGEEIYISVDSFIGARYVWEGPTLINVPNDLNRIRVTTNANLFHRGWYYVRTTYKNCPSRYDSVFVNVKLNQGISGCNPTNNTSTYSAGRVNVPNKNFTSVSSSTSSYYEISAGGSSGGDLRLIFSSYWVKNKLETGIYYTTHDQTFTDKESINKVYLEDLNFNERWLPEKDKPIFVSYINGKLTITICDLYVFDPSSTSFLNSRLNTRLTLQ